MKKVVSLQNNSLAEAPPFLFENDRVTAPFLDRNARNSEPTDRRTCQHSDHRDGEEKVLTTKKYEWK